MTITIALLWWQTVLIIWGLGVAFCFISGSLERGIMGMLIMFHGTFIWTILVGICTFFYWLGMK